MKNVGILTIQKSPSSYGANLQCYALWKYIKSLGYNCDVIDLIRPCHQKYRNYGKILENNFMYDKSNVISKFKNKLLHSLFRSRMYIQENSCLHSLLSHPKEVCHPTLLFSLAADESAVLYF